MKIKKGKKQYQTSDDRKLPKWIKQTSLSTWNTFMAFEKTNWQCRHNTDCTFHWFNDYSLHMQFNDFAVGILLKCTHLELMANLFEYCASASGWHFDCLNGIWDADE